MTKQTLIATDMFQQALELDSRGDENEAIDLYEKAISLGLSKKNRQAALICLGSSYRIVGRVSDSINLLQRAGEEFPNNLGAQVFLAMSYYSNRQFQESTRLLLGVIATKPKKSDLKYFQRAIKFYSDNL